MTPWVSKINFLLCANRQREKEKGHILPLFLSRGVQGSKTFHISLQRASLPYKHRKSSQQEQLFEATWVLWSFPTQKVCGQACLLLSGIGILPFLLGKGYLLVWGLWLRGNLWKQQALPGMTFWRVYLVHIISKDAVCGPELGCVGRWQKEITLGMCLMLKTNNALVWAWVMKFRSMTLTVNGCSVFQSERHISSPSTSLSPAFSRSCPDDKVRLCHFLLPVFSLPLKWHTNPVHKT